MACLNWPDMSLYTASTFGEYDVYPSQVFVEEHMDVCAPETSANGWGVREQQDHDDVDRWPTSLEPEVNFGKHNYNILKSRGLTCLSPEPTTSGTSYDQWLYPELHWHITEQYLQPDYTTYGNLFASAATLEAHGSIPAPGNSEPFLLLGGFEEQGIHQPRTDWGGDESEQITDTLYAVGG